MRPSVSRAKSAIWEQLLDVGKAEANVARTPHQLEVAHHFGFVCQKRPRHLPALVLISAVW